MIFPSGGFYTLFLNATSFGALCGLQKSSSCNGVRAKEWNISAERNERKLWTLVMWVFLGRNLFLKLSGTNSMILCVSSMGCFHPFCMEKNRLGCHLNKTVAWINREVKSKYGHRFENPQAKSNFCKRFFRTKIYQITKFLLHSKWCPSDKISAMIFHAKKHSHVVPVHANVQMEAPTAPRGFDFGPLDFGSTPSITLLVGDSAKPIYYKSSFATGIMGGD